MILFFRTSDQSELEVDGYSSTNSQQRISLGGISNPFREEKVRQCQKNIREGKMPNFVCHFHVTYTPSYYLALGRIILEEGNLSFSEWNLPFNNQSES